MWGAECTPEDECRTQRSIIRFEYRWSSLATHQWSYQAAFKRNRGLITEEEQEKLRNSRVAIAGMGGVGGVHLVTLARLGIGKFTIADPDVFEVANFNRQYGATISNLGRNKAEAMAEAALDINPELDLRVMPEAIDESNVDEFFETPIYLSTRIDAFQHRHSPHSVSQGRRAWNLRHWRRTGRFQHGLGDFRTARDELRRLLCANGLPETMRTNSSTTLSGWPRRQRTEATLIRPTLTCPNSMARRSVPPAISLRACWRRTA